MHVMYLEEYMANNRPLKQYCLLLFYLAALNSMEKSSTVMA